MNITKKYKELYEKNDKKLKTLKQVMNADRIMDEGDRIRTIGTLMSYLDDSPMICSVVCIKGVIAEVKFHLDREYTLSVTQKGLDELEKSNG
tara:strand:+ start:247 stop:522 length:276 start_codon:yes stop_codon:yes gene_type:complete